MRDNPGALRRRGWARRGREFRTRLPRHRRVVLVDREREHLFAPSLLWLMVLREADSIKRPLAKLQRKGIDVQLGEIEKIYPQRKAVTVSAEDLVADYVTVSLGAEPAPETIPGLAEAGHNFYTLPGAESLREALGRLERGRVVVPRRDGFGPLRSSVPSARPCARSAFGGRDG
jgi:sulfide:quinone oxidoreductase